VSALSFSDETRQISALIRGFLEKVAFGRDLEQTLNFLVDARAAFSNLDSVLEQLVLRVNMLAAKAHSIVKGQHSRKTAAFVRSCAAYTFITIPSMTGWHR
jgi:hypothetical protein